MAEAETKEHYIKRMMKRNHTRVRAEAYWDAKGDRSITFTSDADEELGGTFGGQIGRAYDDNFDFTISEVVGPNSKSTSRTERLLIPGIDEPVLVFKKTGIPVIRKVGDRTRYRADGGQ